MFCDILISNLIISSLHPSPFKHQRNRYAFFFLNVKKYHSTDTEICSEYHIKETNVCRQCMRASKYRIMLKKQKQHEFSRTRFYVGRFSIPGFAVRNNQFSVKDDVILRRSTHVTHTVSQKKCL